MYLSNAELSKAIQERLKKAGIEKKSYSISAKNSGSSTSVAIKVKNLAVRIGKVESIAKGYESYEVDQANGEILQGGNTFIFVSYDRDVLDNESQKFMQKASEIFGHGFAEVMAREQDGTRLVYIDYDKSEGRLEVMGSKSAAYHHYESLPCLGVETVARGIALYNANGSIEQ